MKIMDYMMRKALLLLTLLVLALPAHALKIRIDINDPNREPLPTAVVPFYGETAQAAQLGEQIREVIVGDLTNSAIFNVVDKKAYLQSAEAMKKGGPIFHEWRLVNADVLLTGQVELVQDGLLKKLRVSFELFDTQREKRLVGWRYKVDARYWRFVGHLISDLIYNAITGEEGYFATRIVYIGEEPTPNGHVKKKLCVMDQDGASSQCLTRGDHLVLTPRFSPTEQKIIYMSYASGRPRLYLHDLPTGQQQILGDFEGLNSSPRFAPSGKKVVMTLTKGHAGNPEIYEMDLATKKLKRLTFHRGIDTSPSFSPDGKWIVFNSTRGGKPNLYIMDRAGNKVRRLTFGKGSFFAPEWSPRGDLIAFVKQHNGRFSIGVIDPDGTEERQLTESYLDESPTWSPNGRVIIFARQMGDSTRLYSVDLTGYNLRQVKTPTDASDPAWSPLLR